MLNSKVLIWHKNGNWTKPYYLLAVENEIYCIQLPSRLTSFRSMSVKPYFQSEDICNIKLDKLEVFAKLDKLKVLIKLDKLEALIKLNKLKIFTKLDKPEAFLPTLKAP